MTFRKFSLYTPKNPKPCKIAANLLIGPLSILTIASVAMFFVGGLGVNYNGYLSGTGNNGFFQINKRVNQNEITWKEMFDEAQKASKKLKTIEKYEPGWDGESSNTVSSSYKKYVWISNIKVYHDLAISSFVLIPLSFIGVGLCIFLLAAAKRSEVQYER